MLQPCKSSLPERMQEGIAPRREKVYERMHEKEFFGFAGEESSEYGKKVNR